MWESRVLRRAFERLELHEGKLSRAVLRGGGGGNVTSLPDPSRRITGRSTQSCLAEDRQSGPIQVDGIRPEQWANLDRVALLTWEGPAFFRRLAELHRARLLTIEAEDFYRELDEHG